MFRKNERTRQPKLFSDLDHLTPKTRKRLEQSWAGVFRREFYERLDEELFAVLYSDIPSRPNVPINVLVSLEALKAGFGWSDEEMQDAYLFDVQVRYAVGYDNLGEGEFELRTVYNFRKRVCEHMQKTGENLIEKAFEQVTDEQVAAFEIKTSKLRMDSSQIASNIQQMGRLQLLVEMLQRVDRMLSDADKAQYQAEFALYRKGTSGQYVYHLKGEDVAPHLERIGQLMQRLVSALASSYKGHVTYQMLTRVFAEHFIPVVDKDEREDEYPPDKGEKSGKHEVRRTPQVKVRPGKALKPTNLRSPDDPHATYRKKAGQAYEGYVLNVTESCGSQNPFQLIVKMQSAPNITEDTTFLEQAIPELKNRTAVQMLYNDGGYCSAHIDEVLHDLKVEQIPSALRGKKPNPTYTQLADCTFILDQDQQPVQLTCPHDRTAHISPGRKPGRYVADWDAEPCPDCHFSTHLIGYHSSAKTCVRFSRNDLFCALRRQRMRTAHAGKKNLRAAVESTVAAIKRPFGNDKLPVRGRIRMSQMLIGAAVMVNIRRIQRYLVNNGLQGRVSDASSSFSAQFVHASMSCGTNFVNYLTSRLFFTFYPFVFAC
jgi:hypothetical protein